MNDLNNRIVFLLISRGYKPSYTNRLRMLVALLKLDAAGKNPTSFSTDEIRAAIGRMTN